jgi:hypothetical protein
MHALATDRYTVNANAMRRMTGYLLGGLSEPERTAFERDFFSDPHLFDLLEQTETALVDDYVRDRLSTSQRTQFERHYLASPHHRERVEFAQALAAKVDAVPSSQDALATSGVTRMWQAAIATLRASRVPLPVAAAAVAVLIAVSGALLFETQRLRRELVRVETATAQHAQVLQSELSSARSEAANLSREVEQLKQQPPASNSTSAAPSIVSLFLTVRGIRAPDAAPASTLLIPAGTRQVRIQLEIDESEYPTYQLALKPVGGSDVIVRQHIPAQPSSSGFRIAATVQADRMSAGDYLLTLSGEHPNGQLDTVNESLVRVEK